MMRPKPLRTVTLAGPLIAAGRALLHRLPLRSSSALTRWASVAGAVLASIRRWIQLTLAHTSPVQLVEAMGAAWFIFVLALLLLSRPDRAGPLRRQSLIRVSPDTAPPALPLVHRSLLELPQAARDNAPADAADVSQINGNSQELDNGHLLALIGIAANERRCIPCGLVVVAEYVEPVSSDDEASWRTVDVIVCTIIGNDVYVVNFGHSGAHPFRLLG